MEIKLLKGIGTILKEKAVIIPFLVISLSIACYYYYYYVAEHIITSSKQVAVVRHDKFVDEYTVISKCKAVSVFTFAPYVTVKLNEFEVLTTSVHQGFDTLDDCLRSSVEKVEVLEMEKKIQIQMKNGQLKKIDIIYNSK